MYPVSDAFLRAVRSNTRKYFWTGTIVTKGGMTYEFRAKEIVKGSGYISRQCCGSTEIELGTVYAAEMGITLLSDIDRYTLEDAQVTLVFHLVLADGSVEDVPMGVFEVSEANRLAKCLELKAYDFMLRFIRVSMDLRLWGLLMILLPCAVSGARWSLRIRGRRLMPCRMAG